LEIHLANVAPLILVGVVRVHVPGQGLQADDREARGVGDGGLDRAPALDVALLIFLEFVGVARGREGQAEAGTFDAGLGGTHLGSFVWIKAYRSGV